MSNHRISQPLHIRYDQNIHTYAKTRSSTYGGEKFETHKQKQLQSLLIDGCIFPNTTVKCEI